MPVYLLPLVTGLLPIVAIHASLFLAINAGVIPHCIPYIDGCASISATGRYEPAVFLFKPAMTTEAVLMVMYWSLNALWLRSMHRAAGLKREMAVSVMLLLGIAGAVALIVYVTFLGTQTPFYEFMRRFGIYLYFLFTVAAQVLLARLASGTSRKLGFTSVRKTARLQLWLALAPFAFGTVNVVLKSTLDNPDPAENMIEWISSLLMHFYFVLTYFSWRDTGYKAEWTIRALP
jgi:hypothetical protein